MILLGLLEQIMVLIDYLQYNSDGTICTFPFLILYARPWI